MKWSPLNKTGLRPNNEPNEPPRLVWSKMPLSPSIQGRICLLCEIGKSISSTDRLDLDFISPSLLDPTSARLPLRSVAQATPPRHAGCARLALLQSGPLDAIIGSINSAEPDPRPRRCSPCMSFHLSGPGSAPACPIAGFQQLNYSALTRLGLLGPILAVSHFTCPSQSWTDSRRDGPWTVWSLDCPWGH